MDILFVVKDVDYHSPIGMMQVSATAKQKGHKTHLGILSREDIFEKIKKINPQVVAYSGSTGEHKYYKETNKKIKKERPEIKTIMGGPHATFFPEFREEAELDAICIGEGEYAFAEFLERVENGKDFSDLENIVSREIKQIKLRHLIQDLDSLPFPDRALFFDNTENGDAPIKHFIATRGCPYDCTYCFNKSFKKMYKGENYIRRHSVDYIIDEILDVKSKYPLQFIKFYDDILIYKADEWLLEFSEKYKKKVNIPFYCLTRADIISKNPEIARLLRAAGCQTIQMAAESTNDRIRNDLLHRNMGKEQIKKAFKICLDQGMTIVTNYILGLPTSTIQDDINSVYFNIEAGAQVCEFPIFQPYPKTELGELCVKEKLFDGNFDELHMSYNNKSPLSCFTEKEKNIQRNINCLGQLASSFGKIYPSATDLIMKHLIYLPHSDFFADIYSKHKWEVYSSLVYPMEESEEARKVALNRTLRLETFKRTDEKIE